MTIAKNAAHACHPSQAHAWYLGLRPRAALVGRTVPVAAGPDGLAVGVVAVAVDGDAGAGAAHASDGLGWADNNALVAGGGVDAADKRHLAVGVELALGQGVIVVVIDDADGEVVVWEPCQSPALRTGTVVETYW